ncbi:flagellar biosynthetic protein FliO [Catenovulum sediminis]|uniref:Flagellar protein n=1 Tax=Catenovulum sediminis TaxID=1740262 RepID=A0ABV1RHL3_9ALTE|nr:flagellar biosynthetic protein FliO [Catenovulum sediminis]
MARLSMLALCMLCLSTSALAESASITSSITSLLLALVFTIAVIFALAAVAKKTNIGQMRAGALKIVAVLPISNREKLILLDAGESQLLLGVTANSINLLKEFSPPLDVKQADFKQTLAGFMQKKTTHES